ncbi:MAG: hypothetical protein MZW92_78155 [Comamonadaceae bacterium]|nr:hypothetical protein [Comamonadaceae bacterium]
MAAVRRSSGATLLPIDSEHNAVFQSLPRGYRAASWQARGVRRILLTASGGPFRDTPLARAWRGVTPDEACAHPNWVMGRKISVDSATMMNKGLEVIEAHWLFGAPRRADRGGDPSAERDPLAGRVRRRLGASRSSGNPDMRTPIAHALGLPGAHRRRRAARSTSPRSAQLDVRAPDLAALPLPAAGLRRRCARAARAPAVLNAANEVAVAAFLDGRTALRRHRRA